MQWVRLFLFHWANNVSVFFVSQVAGNAVKRAADNLVRAAKKAAIFEEEETTVIINQRFVGGIAQELEAQEHVLRIEKELELARMKLGKIRQARYVPEDDD
jgi:talin